MVRWRAVGGAGSRGETGSQNIGGVGPNRDGTGSQEGSRGDGTQ